MIGFFTNKETESLSYQKGKTYNCHSCNLYTECNTPKMRPYGQFKRKIMVIGEAPGEVEDQRGKPFQGKIGQLLIRTFNGMGVDLFEDCLCTNAVWCRPMEKKENREPSNYEIDCCRQHLIRTIQHYKPKVIIPLGNSALYSLIGHRWKRGLNGIATWRGWTIPDQDFKAWICPTFHPSFIERVKDDVELVVWKNDLMQAVAMLKEHFPEHKEPKIDIIEDLSILRKLHSNRIAIDYETTGLKPHANGHRIICASIADTENHAYVFMIPETKKERTPFLELLEDKRVEKMAHNIKFEQTWSVVRLRQTVNNWVWDSMLAAHILDNRSGVTSLKFQTYVNFGIVDYASEITPYLQSTSAKNANALNRINELLKTINGKQNLLKYCALDAVYEYRLAQKQSECFLPF